MKASFPIVLARAVGTLFRLTAVVFVGAIGPALATTPYQPLDAVESGPVATLALDVHDVQRNRDLPLKIYLPPDHAAAPVLLYSPGLGGTRDTSAFLGEHWARRGYVSVFLQHPGSDDSVWRGLPPEARAQAMRDAASLPNYLLRVKDVAVVLDQLERWSRDAAHPLAGRLDLERVGMSGHSFGAVTTQAVSGQRTASGLAPFVESRIRAALIMSPSPPRRGATPQQAFAAVSIPWMLMTGTADRAPIGDVDVASRLTVYPALPPGEKYELVLYGAEHSAFTDRSLPGDRNSRNPNHHRVVLALSTAFWDATLRGDAQARAWLDGGGPASVLEPQDHWQHK